MRRAIVARLSRGAATVNELAAPFAITKQAVSKHIQVLEQAGLVTRSRDAQRRPVHLDAAALERLTAWIDRYRLVAEDRFRRLDTLLDTLKDAEMKDAEQKGLDPTTITAAPGLPFVDTTREFDAPIAAVFRAHTDRDLYAQWLGPREAALKITEFDATTGGRWAYGGGAGAEAWGFHGFFHAVQPNALIIQTFEFSGAPNAVGIGITTFEEVNGKTRLSAHEVYPTVEVRDMALASGMEYGVIEGYERLDEILAR